MIFESLCRFPNAWTSVTPGFGVHLFEGHLSVADMDRMEILGDEWHAKNPGRIVELVVIFPSAARLDDAERKRILRLIARRESARVASATVILAEGMVGAVQRSMLTGLGLVRRPPHPMKVFSAVSDAVTWLAPHLKQTCPGAVGGDVSTAVEHLCASFRAR
jgi:hypothetical protein